MKKYMNVGFLMVVVSGISFLFALFACVLAYQNYQRASANLKVLQAQYYAYPVLVPGYESIVFQYFPPYWSPSALVRDWEGKNPSYMIRRRSCFTNKLENSELLSCSLDRVESH